MIREHGRNPARKYHCCYRWLDAKDQETERLNSKLAGRIEWCRFLSTNLESPLAFHLQFPCCLCAYIGILGKSLKTISIGKVLFAMNVT